MSLDALLAALRHTALQQRLFTEAAATSLAIGATDLECLLLLRDVGPASAGQLADVLGLTTGAVTGVIDRLASAGFVVRESDPTDRRRVIVQPVPQQLARLQEDILQPLHKDLAHALEPLSEDALAHLVEFERRTGAVFEQAAARLRAEQTASGAATSFSAALGALESAALEFTAGASNVRINAAADASGDLYRASFEGIQPSVRVQGGTVSVRYRRMGLLEWGTARHAAMVALNARIPWNIALHGGASGAEIDLRGIQLRGFALDGGASKVELSLPAPLGSVAVCVDGGANRLHIQRPDGVPVQLQVRGGANRLEFDGQRFGAVGGDVRLASPGWELATDRYVIEVQGGASRLTVQEL